MVECRVCAVVWMMRGRDEGAETGGVKERVGKKTDTDRARPPFPGTIIGRLS